MSKECPTPAGTLLIIGGKENKGADGPENREAPADFHRLERDGLSLGWEVCSEGRLVYFNEYSYLIS